MVFTCEVLLESFPKEKNSLGGHKSPTSILLRRLLIRANRMTGRNWKKCLAVHEQVGQLLVLFITRLHSSLSLLGFIKMLFLTYISSTVKFLVNVGSNIEQTVISVNC